ncbi:MAG: sigma 54-interacting transcriptional regulator [Myxococcota bacterium]
MTSPPSFGDGWTIDATASGAYLVRQFRLVGEEDPAIRFVSEGDACSIGSDESNDLVLPDRSVSRYHCELRIDQYGARLRDLGSRNGTRIDGVRIQEAWLRADSRIRVGRTQLRFEIGESHNRIPLSPRTELGTLVGHSVPMRAVFAQLERVAPSELTVLLSGETGTGKEEVAATVHQLSARSEGPFVVLDCGAVSEGLLESRLFGHARGAFTGADDDRPGLFERAEGGTIFLDEIAELPLDVQPKLLRVLERREVRRVGETDVRPVSVRVVAASHRDLRLEVAAGRFREDLYYRLAVFRLTLPPLRERPDDIAPLVERFVEAMTLDRATRSRLRSPVHLARLRQGAWPGNVRQLRNYLIRAAIFEEAPMPSSNAETSMATLIDTSVPYSEARRRIIAHFSRAYAERIVAEHGGNVSRAAEAAGVGRTYLHRLLKADLGSSGTSGDAE